MKGKLVVRVIALIAAAFLLILIGGIGFVYLAPETATHTFLAIERKRSGLVRKEIDLPDGTHYVYLEGGQGEPLMLLHGFGANKDSFARVSRYLTSRYRVIVPDHIGFGESSHLQDADYSPIAQAERLHALANGLGLSSVHLGGNSMGGHIAMSYAALYPDEVKSLWLLDPGGIWTAPKSELRQLIEETGQNPLIVRNEEDFAALLTMVMTKRPFIPKPIINVMAQERIKNYDLEKRIFGQITGDSIEERIKGLATPSLIVWGDQDRLINVATTEILNGLLPNSKVIIMRGIGHVPMVELPQESADDYLRFRATFSN